MLKKYIYNKKKYIKKYKKKKKNKIYRSLTSKKKTYKKILKRLILMPILIIHLLDFCIKHKTYNMFNGISSFLYKYKYKLFNILLKKKYIKKKHMELFFFKFLIEKDLKKLISNSFKKYLNSLSFILFYEDKFGVVCAKFLCEYVKYRLLQKFSVFNIIGTTTTILDRILMFKPTILKGYKIIIKGRPVRSRRARKFVLKNGIIKSNSLSIKLEYASGFVRTKFGISGIKV